jgi:hypothetical protein
MPEMMRSRPIQLFAVLSWLIVASVGGGLTAQKPASKPKPDPEVAEKASLLVKIAKDKTFAKDAEGVATIDVLMQKQAKGLSPKDEQLVVKALDNVLNKYKVRPPARVQLYVAAAEALGRHGGAGAKILKKAYENKGRFKAKPPWVPLRERLLRNVGRTKDESVVKFLIDEAQRSPEAALQAAAGEALGNFDESKQKLRREIVSKLLTTFGSLSQRASLVGTSVDAQNAKDRLAALSGKWVATLKKLTGQKFDTFREWQTWYNKNKSKKW